MTVPVKPWKRGDSATRPLSQCQPCRIGNHDYCYKVYRSREGHGRHSLCRCVCRSPKEARA